MRKIISATFIVAFFVGATTSIAQNSYTAKKDITLKFKGSDGTNGSAVVWNADKKVYYATIAGNADYPLEAFSESDKNLFEGNAMIDTRGLWYNSKSGKLEGNGAGEVGYFYREIESSGIPGQSTTTFNAGQHQPDFQSVGAFDGKKKVYYFYDGKIYTYSNKGKGGKSFELKNSPAGTSSLNATTVVYTGRKGEELGLLDIEAQKVYLFDVKGNYKASVSLPSGAVTHDMFRFSSANGKIWLYDVDTRSWTGYSF